MLRILLVVLVASVADCGPQYYGGHRPYISPAVALVGPSRGSTVGSIYQNGAVKGGSLPPTKGGSLPPALQGGSPIKAAVQSRRWVEFIPQLSTVEEAPVQLIEVEGYTSPIRLMFRTNSAPIYFQQSYIPALQQAAQHTRTEEEAQRLSHEVYKPVIQEIREVIQPFRKVHQEIRPVVEEVRTVVAQSNGQKTELPTVQQNEHESQNQEHEQQQELPQMPEQQPPSKLPNGSSSSEFPTPAPL